MHAEQAGQWNEGDGLHPSDQTRNQEYIEHVVHERTGIDQHTVKTVFNTFWDVICEELENGNAVKLHGKGKYYLSKRKPRVGRNPSTGQEYGVPEREVMMFSPSPAYAKRLREVRNRVKPNRFVPDGAKTKARKKRR